MDRAVNFSMRAVVDRALRAGRGAVWPATCLACGEPGDARADRDLCDACHARLPWQGSACPRCALPLPAGSPDLPCGACQSRASPLAEVRAAFAYAAPLDRLLPMLKFHHSLPVARLLSGLMAESLAGRYGDFAPDAVLLPLPLHAARLRKRGYDQSLELARPLARACGLPLATGLLRRCKATRAQSRLHRDDRRANLRGAFRVREHVALPSHVVLLDDVMTTGATLESAAQALRDAGVARVDAWVCARVA